MEFIAHNFSMKSFPKPQKKPPTRPSAISGASSSQPAKPYFRFAHCYQLIANCQLPRNHHEENHYEEGNNFYKTDYEKVVGEALSGFSVGIGGGGAAFSLIEGRHSHGQTRIYPRSVLFMFIVRSTCIYFTPNFSIGFQKLPEANNLYSTSSETA